MKSSDSFIKRKSARILFLTLTVIMGLAAAWLLRYSVGELFPSTELKLNKLVYVSSDSEGRVFTVDNECRRVVCADRNGEIKFIISDVPFEGIGFITDIVAAEDGGCYVQYLFQNIDSYTTKFESICRFDSRGKLQSEIYRIDYQNADTPPHRNNAVFGMTLHDGNLMFMLRSEDGIRFASYSQITKTVSEIGMLQENGASLMHLMARFVSEDQYIFASADGGIGVGTINGEENILATFSYTVDDGGIQPYYIVGDEEDIFFTDIFSGSIFHVGRDGSIQSVLENSSCNYLSYSSGGLLAVGDGGLFRISPDGSINSMAAVFRKPVWMYASGHLALGCIIIAALSFLFFICSLMLYRFKMRFSIYIKQAIATIPLIVVMLAVSLNYVRSTVYDILMENMKTSVMGFASLNSDKFDGDEIEKLVGFENLNSDEFNNMHSTLQEILHDNKDSWNRSYYTAIYLLRANDMFLLAISNDSSPNLSYYSTIEEDSDEWHVFHDGRSFVTTDSDFEGDWVYAQTPIRNCEDRIVAVLETGADLNAYKIMTDNLISRTIGKFMLLFPVFAICLTAVGMLTIHQLRKTSYAVEEIANGNFDVRINGLSHDEIGDIGRGVNTMAEKLTVSFRRSEELKNTYFKFVPIQFMQLLDKKSITDINLGDAVCTDITVLFFDIRAFSKKSEMMTTSENFTFVNNITKTAGPIIRGYNGFVDKYIGDAVMALFTDAQSAVDAGIELYRALVLDNPELRFGGEEIRIGIGIHSGMSMLGIIGENERLSSTVISDTVNLASRLESLTKQYNTGMIISKDTLDRLSDSEKYHLRFLGMVQVAGVNEVKALYEVLDCLCEGERDARLSTKDVFENGVKKFHLGNCRDALTCFRSVGEANPNDKCIDKYVSLAEECLQSEGSDSRVIRFTQK